MFRVLLVCTGNVCRSPMAEGLLRKMLREHNRHGEIVVESAGTFPLDGSPASTEAIETAAEDGVDIRGHVARSLSARLVDRSDLILTMEPGHIEDLVASFSGAGSKTFLLTLFGDVRGDQLGVPDPIGLGVETYRAVYRMIKQSLEAAIPKIVERVPQEPKKKAREAN
jgi:protein-tyrosine phosphatase